ncbi:hypothetical protein [Nostoc sp. LPT]|uniref:hypothetical protein n=1 Tax=Nostoc sp. LPT TaxID=2815387 RepID=UPI001E0E268F|nr:hypothetical protein [Nostoc sp. LPT]MBN4004760.1 hypothetical protein [Nostoc sp. LPT]
MLAYSTVAGINTNLIMTETDNAGAPRQLTLFAVELVATAPPFSPAPSCEPEFEELTSSDRWKEADFGEVPHQSDNGQLTIFYDDSDEPPDPDDFLNLTEYKQAWSDWESARVLEQDTQAVQLVSSHSQISPGDVYDGLRQRPSLVLERDTQNPVPEQKTPGFGDYTDVPEHIKPVPEHLHWLEKYCPSNRKDNHYYRYCWKTGRKIRHRHITGGSVRSQLAQSRKQEVEIAIADGQAPVEIEKLIRSWRFLTPNS